MASEVELEPEVAEWLDSLSDHDFGQVAFHIDRLAELGAGLGAPYTSQLDGRLRELRFYLGRARQRISYFMRDDRTIILLTVFHKTRQRERQEVERAKRAMQRCDSEHKER